jgi:septum site-determining protein MinC
VEVSTAIKPFRIRGRFFTAIALQLRGTVDQSLFEAVDAQLCETPQFFVNAPVVIDLEHAEGLDSTGDMARLTRELRGRNLSVFGVQKGTEAQTGAAKASGLIALPGGRDVPPEPAVRGKTAAPAPSAREAPPPVATIITTPVRSGQNVYAERGDLVVVASVGAGAELVAAGNIHVYGQLRGRALAGVNGDPTARIFCSNLDAELLAIAGLYRTSEDLGADVRRRAVQAYLRDDALIVEPLG